jgi:hypothetical protein
MRWSAFIKNDRCAGAFTGNPEKAIRPDDNATAYPYQKKNRAKIHHSDEQAVSFP